MDIGMFEVKKTLHSSNFFDKSKKRNKVGYQLSFLPTDFLQYAIQTLDQDIA